MKKRKKKKDIDLAMVASQWLKEVVHNTTVR